MKRYKEHATFNKDMSYNGFISGEAFKQAWGASSAYGLNENEEFLLAILLQLHSEGKPTSITSNVFLKESLSSIMKALEAAAGICKVSIIVPTILASMEDKTVYVLKDMADLSLLHFGINIDPNAANVSHTLIGVENADYSRQRTEERELHDTI